MDVSNQKIPMKIEARNFLRFLSENLGQLSETHQPLWHPLGFVSCLIKKEDGSHSVRVHYWPNGERRVKNPDWPIHTHSYELSSLVLSGTVRDIQYSSVIGTDYSLYSVRYFGEDSEIVRTSEKISVQVSIDAFRHSGDQYSVARGTFHQTQVDSETSALTLVALSDMTGEPPLVLGHAAEESYPYDRAGFDKKFFWDKVKECVASRKIED